MSTDTTIIVVKADPTPIHLLFLLASTRAA
jgi:hypothetical protein